jgi:hypothetical protein
MAASMQVSQEGGRLTVGSPEISRPLATLQLNEWETEFFERRQGLLTIDDACWQGNVDCPFDDVLATILARADAEDFQLVELRVAIQHGDLVPAIEDHGFRLVDSHFRFISPWTKDTLDHVAPEIGSIRQARHADLPRLVELTMQGFSRNESFHSRFKHPRYYRQSQSDNYYAAWLTKCLGAPNTHFVAWVVDEEVVGYYIYQQTGEKRGLPVYRARLVTVDPRFRGNKGQLAMQSQVFADIPHERWYLDNTTQLDNYPVLKNHIQTGKQFQDVVLIFYRAPVESID